MPDGEPEVEVAFKEDGGVGDVALEVVYTCDEKSVFDTEVVLDDGSGEFDGVFEIVEIGEVDRILEAEVTFRGSRDTDGTLELVRFWNDDEDV